MWYNKFNRYEIKFGDVPNGAIYPDECDMSIRNEQRNCVYRHNFLFISLCFIKKLRNFIFFCIKLLTRRQKSDNIVLKTRCDNSVFGKDLKK